LQLRGISEMDERSDGRKGQRPAYVHRSVYGTGNPCSQYHSNKENSTPVGTRFIASADLSLLMIKKPFFLQNILMDQ
jgi:hypothetical protein